MERQPMGVGGGIQEDKMTEQIPSITNTELKILLLLRRPYTAQEIADSFGITKEGALVNLSRMTVKGMVDKWTGPVNDGTANGRTYQISAAVARALASGHFADQIEKLVHAGDLVG
jgi:predicted ArsR family transcriptional regulator